MRVSFRVRVRVKVMIRIKSVLWLGIGYRLG